MHFLFTLCGRAGSKGVKNKNTKDFLGAPLAYYSLAAMKLYADACTGTAQVDVALNTDSIELIAQMTGQAILPVIVIERDVALADDTTPKVSVIMDCMKRASKISGHRYDAIIDLDITSPLRTVTDIDNAIVCKMKNPDADVVYSVTNSRRNPYFNLVCKKGKFFDAAIPSTFSARQQAPDFFDMNASIYVYSPDALLHKEAKTFFRSNAMAILMKDTAVLDIDSEEDFELMQVVAKYFYETYPEFFEVQSMAKEIWEGAKR